MAIKREDLDAGRVDFSDITSGKRVHFVSPGVFLKEEFLDEYGLSISAAASAMKMSRARLNEIVRGERGITADTALRLGQFFGNSAQFWMNLQSHFDLIKASTAAGKKIKNIPKASEIAENRV
ncbi:MAG: HigA family addiction module antitoxin [Bdellovibrionales bacterium]